MSASARETSRNATGSDSVRLMFRLSNSAAASRSRDTGFSIAVLAQGYFAGEKFPRNADLRVRCVATLPLNLDRASNREGRQGRLSRFSRARIESTYNYFSRSLNLLANRARRAARSIDRETFLCALAPPPGLAVAAPPVRKIDANLREHFVSQHAYLSPLCHCIPRETKATSARYSFARGFARSRYITNRDS